MVINLQASTNLLYLLGNYCILIFLTHDIIIIIPVDNGNDTIQTKANFQPLTIPMITPAKKHDSKNMKIPILSPIPSSILVIFLEINNF